MGIYDEVKLDARHGEIRIIRIDATSLETNQPLTCSFVKHRLVILDKVSNDIDTTPQHANHSRDYASYSAVSYTWGTSTATTEMIIDGIPALVPYNTELALRRLLTARLDGSGTNPRDIKLPLLWIDALCINQDDLLEKSQQVSMMGEIFSQSSEVLVWLGDDLGEGPALLTLLTRFKADCARATEDFTKILDVMYPVNERGNRERANRRLYDQRRECDAHIIDDIGSDISSWALLTRFYSLPWFGRVWIVQEILLARTATLYWGSTIIPWDLVTVAANWLSYGLTSDTDNVALKYYVDQAFNAAQKTVSLHSMSKEGVSTLLSGLQFDAIHKESFQHTLASLLIFSQSFDTTRPEDRIFALLGLLPPETRETAKEVAALSPDYTLDVAAVFTRGTRAAIVTTETLTYLKLAGVSLPAHAELEGLPTWVPCYGQKTDGAHDFPSLVLDRTDPGGLHKPLVIDRSDPKSTILRVKGHRIDVAEVVGVAIPSNKVPSDRPLTEAEHEKLVLEMIRVVVVNWRLAKTMVEDDSAESKQTLRSIADALCNGYTTQFKVATQVDGFLDHFKELMDLLETFDQDMNIPNHLQPLMMSVLFRSYNRPFFITAEARFGMGPPGMREGDCLVHLFGHPAPFVLRAEDDQWLLVGDVYLASFDAGLHCKALDEAGMLEDNIDWYSIH